MPWLIAVFLIVLLVVLIVSVRKGGAVQSEIRTCLNETGDAEKLKTLLKKRGLRAMSADAETDDAMVRLCRMERDEAGMEKALAKMNRRATPIQLDYLWGVDRFYYALMRLDVNDMKQALSFVNQVADGKRKKKMALALDGMKAVTELFQAPRTAAALTPALTRLLGAFEAETGFSRVEAGWILEDLAAAGISVRPVKE